MIAADKSIQEAEAADLKASGFGGGMELRMQFPDGDRLESE